MERALVKVEWRFASTTPMETSVLISGMRWTPKLSVGSWDSLEMVRHHWGVLQCI